jgi:hypothetical protein
MTQCKGVLIEKLKIIIQLVSKLPTLYGTHGSLPCSQDPATGRCSGPDESSPKFHTVFL